RAVTPAPRTGTPPAMHNARVDTTSGPDGTKLVVARFDLGEEESAAVARAVDVSRTEQFRNEELSTDDVVAMRELTALADQLTALAGYGGAVSVRIHPATSAPSTAAPARSSSARHGWSRCATPCTCSWRCATRPASRATRTATPTRSRWRSRGPWRTWARTRCAPRSRRPSPRAAERARQLARTAPPPG